MICLELSGIQTQGEVATNKGHIDVLCQLAGMFYIFELKVGKKATNAIRTYALLGTNSMRSTPKYPLKHFKWFIFSSNMFVFLSKTEHALQSA